MAKLVDGVVTEKYLWQSLTTLLAVYDANDNVKQRFEYGLGHTPVSFTQSGQRYYIQTDHLGSPRVISSATGTVIKTLSYDSYGNVISDSNPEFTIPFGFAGGLQDSDTGLIRFGYRDYDPETGRWTARDPIGFAGGDTNLYGYVLGDPVNFIDPIGLMNWNWGDFKAGYAQGLADASLSVGNPNVSGGANTCSTEYAVGRALGEGIVRGGRGGSSRAPTLKMSVKSTRNLPTSRSALHTDLTGKGYKFNGVSQNGYVTYKGPDGKTVTVKPTGEVIPTQKVWKSDGSGKFPQRQDYDGSPLLNQSHSTDHFVEPFVGPVRGGG